MSVFGEIAKNVGEEVAKGLEKNVAPIAKDVVDKVSNWGFIPKVGEVSGSDAINALRKKRITGMSQPEYSTFTKQINKAVKEKKLDKSTPKNYAVLFEGFEKEDVPRQYTGKLGSSLISYIKKQPQRTFSQNYIQDIARRFKDLETEQQRETFISMLPQWDQSIDDLFDNARYL